MKETETRENSNLIAIRYVNSEPDSISRWIYFTSELSLQIKRLWHRVIDPCTKEKPNSYKRCTATCSSWELKGWGPKDSFVSQMLEGFFFCIIFSSFNFFHIEGFSLHIPLALASHYTNTFCMSKVLSIFMSFYLSWHFCKTIYNFLSFHTIIAIIHFKNCKLK